jgi:hypothetical protein
LQVKGEKAMKKYLGLLTIVVSASIQPAAGAGCEKPRSSQEVATCLGGELRDTLWMGCANPEHAHGGLLNIRTHDAGYGVHAVGVALDLQDGKMYVRNNGSWDKGAPGSAKGLDLKLGRIYKCGLTSTIAVSPLEKLNFVEVNFGSKPFKYALPDGYRPFAP